MTSIKSLLASKTFWGAAIAVAASLAGLFGYAIAPEDQGAALDAVANFIAALGALFAIYGRIKATKQIG